VKYIKISNQTKPLSQPILAKYCQSFFCQLRGLMFRKMMPDDQGLVLVQRADSKINSSIHMMFMWIDLAVIWINSEYTVVDRVLARRWKLGYLPKSPAMYVLETGVEHINDFEVGDKVYFEDTLSDLNG
jgi:uncharacterized membrane protein (UPF0127 family)